MSNYSDELINNYNCPDCNDAKLQSDKNARKINEVIDQVNALIQVNNETVDFIEDKANETVKREVNKLLDELNTELYINLFDGNSKEEKLINMIKYACENNYKKVFVPCGEYNFKNITSDTIVLPESFNKIIIEGENTKETIFRYDESHIDKPFLKVRGGSGSLSMGYIKNITFIGNDTTTAIELNHVCGYEVINCIFGTNKIGVLMHNSHSGGFTEFNIVRNCDFYQDCNTALEYKVSNGGDRSFHGSGMKNCVINQSDNEVNSKIIIGSGCLPYNAPLDATFFIRCQTPLIHNIGYTNSNFYGNIRTEQFGTSYKGTISDTVIHYVGGINSLTEVSIGNLVLCERIQLNSDGSASIQRKPWTVVTTGVGKVNNIYVPDSNESFIIHASTTAGNWEQSGVYITGKAQYNDNGTVYKLCQTYNFNANGWNMGEVVYEGGVIKYKNNNIPDDSSFNMVITITPIGTRFFNVLS